MQRARNEICTAKLINNIMINLLLSALVLVAVRNFWNSSRLFDQIVLICVLVSLLQVVFAFLRVAIPEKELRNIRSVFFSFCDLTVLTIVSVFLLSAPLLNVDRSRSFYVLYCVQHQVALNSDSNRYISKKNGAEFEYGVSLRLRENQDRGLLASHGSKLDLTTAGKTILFIGEKSANLFKLRGYHEIKNEIIQTNHCPNL